jgi:hypothetical protein
MKRAAEIVEMAKRFGRQHDITVVTITRERSSVHLATAIEAEGDAVMRPQAAA